MVATTLSLLLPSKTSSWAVLLSPRPGEPCTAKGSSASGPPSAGDCSAWANPNRGGRRNGSGQEEVKVSKLKVSKFQNENWEFRSFKRKSFELKSENFKFPNLTPKKLFTPFLPYWFSRVPLLGCGRHYFVDATAVEDLKITRRGSRWGHCGCWLCLGKPK